MELIHKINGTIIEEPVGFDDFECKVSRGDYHGISAEVSVGSLEFYGSAYNTIKAAYEDDIDTKLAYAVSTDAGVSVFDGVLDLSTCEFQDSEYRSVSVKVGDVGKKTTFNNRTETDIDLNGCKTIDGADLEQPEWMELSIPGKHLLYTDIFSCKTTKEEETITDVAKETAKHFVSVPLVVEKAIEYGVHGSICRVMNAKTTQSLFHVIVGEIPYTNDTSMAVFREDGDFESNFGEDTTHDIELHVKASIEVPDDCLVDVEAQGVWMTGTKCYEVYLVLVTGEGTVLWQSAHTHIGGDNLPNKITLATYDVFNPDAAGAIIEDVSTDEQLYFGFMLYTDYTANSTITTGATATWPSNSAYTPKVTVYEGSYIKSKMYDNVKTEASAKMISVHDALNVVTKAISENELSVKSSWYGSELSKWNAESGYGGGSLKAITNGYKIRGVYDEDRNMPVSFRTLIESLNAQDCIGWGFSQEGGSTCIRVERWSWFYKNATVLTLTDANEVHRSVDTGKIVTELKIGYKKYATTEQYNSIDSIHGVRTFTSGIKAISSKSERLCSFIADNYAIEEVRRLNGKETEQNSYDENIFVFELISEAERRVGGTTTVTIGHTATNAVDVGIASELINAKLSPRNMASRWRSYIFATAAPSDMRLTSGELNYKGSFGVIPQRDDRFDVTTYSLATENTAAIQAEDADIENVRAAFRAETISFNYPLTIEQYKAVLSNPYGLVVVNGIPGWIKEFTYKINEGLASFKLIPKYEG